MRKIITVVRMFIKSTPMGVRKKSERIRKTIMMDWIITNTINTVSKKKQEPSKKRTTPIKLKYIMRSVDILYERFKPYVKKKDRDTYRKEFVATTKNSIKFVKDSFPGTLSLSLIHI